MLPVVVEVFVVDGVGKVEGVVLDVLGVDRSRMRQVLEQTVLRGRLLTAEDQLSYTSRAKAVLELAMAEARVSKAGTVDTQHLLLGLVREERGIAAQVLLDFGVTVDKTRAELARLRKENTDLRMERELLKKWAAFFAKENA